MKKAIHLQMSNHNTDGRFAIEMMKVCRFRNDTIKMLKENNN